MTESQYWLLDQKDEAGLRQTISIMTATKHKDRDDIIAYCETRLEKLNIDVALVENGDMSDFGQM